MAGAGVAAPARRRPAGQPEAGAADEHRVVARADRLDAQRRRPGAEGAPGVALLPGVDRLGVELSRPREELVERRAAHSPAEASATLGAPGRVDEGCGAPAGRAHHRARTRGLEAEAAVELVRVAGVEDPGLVAVGPAVDHLAHELDTEPAPAVGGQDVDVGEVDVGHAEAGHRAAEPDLLAVAVEPDDPRGLAHEPLLERVGRGRDAQ